MQPTRTAALLPCRLCHHRVAVRAAEPVNRQPTLSMAIPYILRRPRLPVIVFSDDRAFRAMSSSAIQKLVRRELSVGAEVRLLDSEWAWFDVLGGDEPAIAPSFVDIQPPTKQSIIEMANCRSNSSEADPVYQPRSLSNRSRQEIFQELLAILPVG